MKTSLTFKVSQLIFQQLFIGDDDKNVECRKRRKSRVSPEPSDLMAQVDRPYSVYVLQVSRVYIFYIL